MSAPRTQITEQDGAPRRRTRGETARTGGMVLLAVIAALFAVLNLEDVKVDWIIGSGRAPLIIVIAISALAGVLIARLAGRRSRGR